MVIQNTIIVIVLTPRISVAWDADFCGFIQRSNLGDHPAMELSINGGTTSEHWMVYFMEHPSING